MPTLNNFIPSEVMTVMVDEAMRTNLVAMAVCNTKYEGVIAQYGSSVKIPVIGDINVGNYSKNTDITIQTLDSSSGILNIDQQKYFAFNIDDIDAKQSIVDLASVAADRAGYTVANEIDKYLFQVTMSGCALQGSTYSLGTAASPISVSYDGVASGSIHVYQALGQLSKVLSQNHVPQVGRFAVIPSWMEMQLVQAGIISKSTADEGAYTNGKVGKVLGFDIYVSENLINASSNATEMYAGITDATSFAGQINSVEYDRIEKQFGSLVKGLAVFGAKCTRPKALAKLICSPA